MLSKNKKLNPIVKLLKEEVTECRIIQIKKKAKR